MPKHEKSYYLIVKAKQSPKSINYASIFENNKAPFNNKNLYSNSKAGTSLFYTLSHFFKLQ